MAPPNAKKIVVNMIVGGAVGFVGVALVVLLSAFVSPVWTLLATSLPFMLIISIATMQSAGVESGRIRGTILLNWISNLVKLVFMGIWMLTLFFGWAPAEGKQVWNSLGIAVGLWVIAVVLIIVFYIYSPRFKTLIDDGMIYSYSLTPQ